MWKEFKEFAFKGNIMDLAVAVIIGGAFGKIVTSFVADIVMPLVGLLTGGVNFAALFVTLGDVPDGTAINTIEEAVAANVPTLNYGLFITHVIDFLIIAIVIFLVIKMLAKANTIAKAKLIKEEIKEEEAPTTKTCQYCKTEVAIEATRCPACTSNLE